MNENNTITLQDKNWGMPVRVLTLITFFLGAFTLVQAILLLSEYYSNYDVSMPVVILFLLITPFAFVAALMFAFGVHKIAQGNGADKNIILGFAMMLLLAVDNGDPLSFMILGAIELICLIIFFLYYQNWGNKALTFCAGVLLVLSFGFEMVEAIRLLSAADITLTLDTFYNLMKKVLNTLLAVQALLFVFALNPSVRVKD